MRFASQRAAAAAVRLRSDSGTAAARRGGEVAAGGELLVRRACHDCSTWLCECTHTAVSDMRRAVGGAGQATPTDADTITPAPPRRAPRVACSAHINPAISPPPRRRRRRRTSNAIKHQQITEECTFLISPRY
ncbi:hypothetical protein O0L34_g16133 [Tuta absoluta]|nr:hypothetical protein O0L34_g16133 [Tuta absoluta]